jgi:hypothetical protein
MYHTDLLHVAFSDIAYFLLIRFQALFSKFNFKTPFCMQVIHHHSVPYASYSSSTNRFDS